MWLKRIFYKLISFPFFDFFYVKISLLFSQFVLNTIKFDPTLVVKCRVKYVATIKVTVKKKMVDGDQYNNCIYDYSN